MAKRCVFPNGVVPIAPYSPGVWVERTQTLYVSGQLGFLDDGKTLAGSVADQTRLALERLGAVLKEQNLGFENVVSTDVLLADMADYAAMNAVYAKFFPSEAPARAAYAVKGLPLAALVEIKAIAVRF